VDFGASPKIKSFMIFVYLIPVYNEAEQIGPLIDELRPFLQSRPGSFLCLIDNASSDETWARIQEVEAKLPGLVLGMRTPKKGQGLAFRTAMAALMRRSLPEPAWVVCSAADLPFGFSDVAAVLEGKVGAADMVIGSKAHKRSSARRGWKRTFMSWAYGCARFFILGMRTRDPQGSLIFRPAWLRLHADCAADDYFFSTEFVYFLERARGAVLEVPVILRPDTRASRVKVLGDGLRMLKQLVSLRLRQGRLKIG
jgi:glycosyltransferase involved in cell wall biosynthesis